MSTQPAPNLPIVDLQIVTTDDNIPSEQRFQAWVAAALPAELLQSEITIRLVSEAESEALNGQYRNKAYPTNVLSFPSGMPEGLDVPYLGDLIICAAVVERESLAQDKLLEMHWAHMVIHGVLHLLGYDHENETDACRMESLETKLMLELGFKNPYDE